MKVAGFSLIEIFIVVAILGILLSALFGTVTSSRIGLQTASEQINRQQAARRAMDRITDELKTAWWQPSGEVCYPDTNEDSDRIDFCIPNLENYNYVNLTVTPMRYYLGGLNNAQLLRRNMNTGTETVICSDIDNIESQKPFFDFTESPVDHKIIDIKIPIIRDETVFTLTSQVNIRSREVPAGIEVIIEDIIEE